MTRHLPVPGEAALVARYRPVALSIARGYFLPGASADDVRQEALVGLLVGIRTFDPALGNLDAFVRLAVTRWLHTAIVTANRQKQRALNEAVSGTVEDGELETFDALPSVGQSVEERFEQRERLRAVVIAARSLSEFERAALRMAVNGVEYTTLPDGKQIDNALQRARRKLREAA